MIHSLTIERRNKLAQVLVSEGSVKVGELAKRLGVTTETIRKDLLYLEKKGIANKGHGGAVAASSNILAMEQPFSKKSTEQIEIKSKLAQAACELISQNSVVVLDAGSTTYIIAKLLAIKSNLTIFTNSLSIGQVLADTNNEVYVIGGKIRGSSLALVGMWGIELFDTLNAEIVFLGMDGLHSDGGPCTASYEESEIKKAMIKSAKVKVIVSDSSKFESSGIFQFCDWKDIDYLITDNSAPVTELEKIRKYTKVILVD